MTDTPRTEDWLDRLYADDEEQPTPPPKAKPAGGGRLPDWWTKKPTDLAPPAIEDEAQPEADEPEQPEPRWLQPDPGYYPQHPQPAVVVERATAALSAKTRSLIYNGTAAGAGWLFGLGPVISHAIADCGATTSIGGALVLGIGTCLVVMHIWDRRTRHWWIGLAWVARIPLATAMTALALYAPASQL